MTKFLMLLSKKQIIYLLVVLILVTSAFLFLKKGVLKPVAPPTTPQFVKIENQMPETTVVITDKGFFPQTIRLKKGGTVSFINQDTQPHQIMSDPHPIHDLYPFLNTDEVLNNGESVAITFEKSGTFTYHDHLNPLKYKGIVMVE